MSQFEEAKAFLCKDVNGSNLFDHLSEVLLKVLTERPGDAVAIFEQLSSSVKREKFTPEGGEDVAVSDRVAQYVKSIQRLHASGDEEPEDESEEPLAPPRAEVLSDLDTDSVAWKAAGVEIDSGDLFKLKLSLARLAGADSSIQTLRLWGKLQGRDADYWVAEGFGGSPAEDEEDESKAEPESEANKHTYWVCSHPGGKWTALPAIRAAEIVCARSIKRFLTGNLEARVIGYPKYPGTERQYVRALIALINAGTAVAPKGYFIVNDDDSVELDADFEMPDAGSLSDAAAWQTYGPEFSELGYVQPQTSTNEDGEEVTQDWEAQPLRDCNPDDWTVRTYPQTLQDDKSAKAILRSNAFPGAYAIACPSTKSWTNIYIGFGHAKASNVYTPPMPPALQREFDVSGLREQADIVEDPTPEDDENKEEE